MNNKLSFISGFSKDDKDLPISEKVHKRINEYLKFVGCSSLLQDTDSLIFGGAVRDSIADLEIHDLDIIVLPKAFTDIAERLIKTGFVAVDKYKIDIANLYSNSKIHEPVNWMKEDICVQLIRPRNWSVNSDSQEFLKDFASNVDISCCGISFFPGKGVEELVPGAIDDCLKKKFHILESSKLWNSNRSYNRCKKLQKRGWKQYEVKLPKQVVDVLSSPWDFSDNTVAQKQYELDNWTRQTTTQMIDENERNNIMIREVQRRQQEIEMNRRLEEHQRLLQQHQNLLMPENSENMIRRRPRPHSYT